MQGPSIHASIREVRRREHRGVECVTGPHRSRIVAGDDGDRRHKRQHSGSIHLAALKYTIRPDLCKDPNFR